MVERCKRSQLGVVGLHAKRKVSGFFGHVTWQASGSREGEAYPYRAAYEREANPQRQSLASVPSAPALAPRHNAQKNFWRQKHAVAFTSFGQGFGVF